MTWLALPALAAAAYYGLALIAALRWPRCDAGNSQRQSTPEPVSILKPVHGRDPGFYHAIRSHAVQDYPEFEILFGVSDPKDSALPDIARLQREFPARPITLHVVATDALNAKTGVLAELAKHARHPILLVNDSDIVVPPGYLYKVTGALADPQVGLVTCLYRASSTSWAGRLESLGIATEFAPSVLVARLLGMTQFALGSTMAFRASLLPRFGGFPAIADYLADDYQLGRHIAQLGCRIVFAPLVVETTLGGQSFVQMWRHQLRWSRTIRVSRRGGYYGYVVTHATLWALVAFAAREWWAGGAALAMRMLAGVVVGAWILKDRYAVTYFWLIPLRDLLGFAVWLCGALGNQVIWRGHRLRLLPDGRICPERN